MSAERVKSICEALQTGATRKAAAESNGITDRTLRAWMARGEEDEENEKKTVFSSFSSALRRSEAECELRWVSTINEAANTDWRAALQLLKRRYPESWGDRLSFKSLPDDILIAVLNRIAEEGG
jgi:transposase-like protein